MASKQRSSFGNIEQNPAEGKVLWLHVEAWLAERARYTITYS